MASGRSSSGAGTLGFGRSPLQRWVDAEVLYGFSAQIISIQKAGGVPNHEASVSKVFGSELANRFLLRLRDPVILISPLGGPPTPLGPAPRMQRFRVAGIS